MKNYLNKGIVTFFCKSSVNDLTCFQTPHNVFLLNLNLNETVSYLKHYKIDDVARKTTQDSFDRPELITKKTSKFSIDHE